MDHMKDAIYPTTTGQAGPVSTTRIVSMIHRINILRDRVESCNRRVEQINEQIFGAPNLVGIVGSSGEGQRVQPPEPMSVDYALERLSQSIDELMKSTELQIS